MTKFSFSLWTWIWLIEIQLHKSLLAFDKVSELEYSNHDKDWKKANSLFMRRFRVSCHGIFNSVIYTKAWSRQVWIPGVSSSLYFWKRICSLRVDNILKWRVYIKLKVSWLRAILWCMSQTSCDRVNSGHVRTHEKNSGDAVCRLGTIIQSVFCAQSGASICLTIWKWSGDNRYPGAFPPVLENFRRAFSPAQLI